LLLGLVVCSRIRSGPLARLLELVRERIRPLFAGCSAGDLALIALSAGIGEELLFRGLIQPGLAVWMPAWAALAITSALFGLAHLVTPTYALVAGLIGLYLGALLLFSDNLVAPVLVHALYDLAALHLLIRLKPTPARSVV
jgi:membrane protease YdiL (CAAX protease family)